MSRGYKTVSLFLLIVLSILALGHYFVYFSLLHFLGIAAPWARVALAAVFFVLTVSFIALTILIHRTEHFFFRAAYFCSALWLGLGLNLILAFALTWVAWGSAKLFLRSPRPPLLGWAAVVAACIYSAYGVWNAGHPRVKRLAVRIRNLPPAWRGKKVAHFSDVHLGSVRRASFIARLVAMLNAERPDLVVITGDLFDGTDGHLEELAAPLNALRAPLGIYFVTGNHETYLGVQCACAALRATPVKILADEAVSLAGLQLVGVSYPQPGQAKNLRQTLVNLPGFDPAQPSILLYHSPVWIAQAKAAGISLQLAGHAHHGQMFPIQFISRLVYGRYYYGLHLEGDYILYTSGGAGTWGPPLRTGNHPEVAVICLV